jgi:hypothetical protein
VPPRAAAAADGTVPTPIGPASHGNKCENWPAAAVWGWKALQPTDDGARRHGPLDSGRRMVARSVPRRPEVERGPIARERTSGPDPTAILRPSSMARGRSQDRRPAIARERRIGRPVRRPGDQQPATRRGIGGATREITNQVPGHGPRGLFHGRASSSTSAALPASAGRSRTSSALAPLLGRRLALAGLTRATQLGLLPVAP